jgi:Amt family ammonium transporter
VTTKPELAWLLISSTLLALTVPGVALFYGGMVRRKNALNTIGLAFAALLVASLVSLCAWPLLVWSQYSSPSGTSASALWPYQTISGALALALVAGGLVERTRFAFFLVFGMLWLALVYLPVSHSLWGAGWLTSMGSLDFAGGAVIHVTAGATALAAAILTGKRRGYGRVEMMPNNLPLSICGAGLMWVGWCGFTAGRGSADMAIATTAFVAIQIAAAAAALAWTAVEWMQRDKPTALGTVSGVVAGLVAIAPAAGYVSPLSALVIGVGAGGFCYMATNFVKPILGYDDSLDVFGMHAVGGAWGVIATGLFASSAVNPDGSDGLFFGYPYQLFAQLVALIAVGTFTVSMSLLLIGGLRRIMPVRVTEEAELMGLDLSQHQETAYF